MTTDEIHNLIYCEKGVSHSLCDWIFRAVNSIAFGEVTLIIHDKEVVRIDTKERKQIDK